MEEARMEAAGMEAAGMEAAGMEAAGMEAAGMEAAGMEAAGMEAARMEAARIEELASQVFNVEPFLDKILNYVIHKGNEVSTADARSTRLVNKDWLRSTTRCLYKSKKPFFRVFLSHENSLNGSAYVRENGKPLDNFLSTITESPFLGKQLPPIQIVAWNTFFRQENHQSLLQFFTQCGNSLLDLIMWLPEDGGSMPLVFPHLSLPKLQFCNVRFRGKTTELSAGERILGVTNCIHLLQNVFSGCEELQRLIVRSESRDNNFRPYGLELVVLPATISTLNLDCYKNVELVAKSDLPNLRKLKICDTEDFHEAGLISKVLLNCRNKLTHFEFHMSRPYRPPRHVTYFQIPTMTELKVFESYSIELELDEDQRMLENKLPKLRKLRLENQTVSMFRKWTENSNYTSVVDLVVSLADENWEFGAFHLNVPSETMQSVSTSFPNLRKLEITVCGTEFCGLKSVFDNLKQLQVLKVIARENDTIVNSDCWDALLIGIPEYLARVLRKKKCWSEITDFKGELFSSIKELTELEKLVLETQGELHEWEKMTSLISDAVFEFAFSKMPKLKTIALIGRFMASPKAKQEWEEMGGEISYKTEDADDYS